MTGSVQIDTLGSDFDTIMAVWTGSNLASLTEIDSNDEYGDSQSAIFIDVVQGTTYRIAIYGYRNAQGQASLSIKSDTTSRISGIVTGPDGFTPLAGIFAIAAYQVGEGPSAYWNYLSFGTTGSDGAYTIRGLRNDSYRVEFVDNENGNYQTESYDDVPELDSAVDIVIAGNTTVTGINASLALGSKITGTVTGPDGTTPLSGISVFVYQFSSASNSWEINTGANTLPDGSYQVGSLSPGTYRLEFWDYNRDYFGEYYDNSEDIDSATSITVAAASTVSGINASLRTASKITGTVTGPNGTSPLAGIEVRAYWFINTPTPVPRWEIVSSTSTGPSGCYQLGPLESGTYRIEFFDLNGGHIKEIYSDALNVNSATAVLVPAGTTVTGINASLVLPTPPEIRGFRKTGPTSFELSFTGTPGSLYWLQESTSLTSWRNVGTPITCQHGVNVRSVSSSEPKIFWRVKVFP